MRSRNCWATYQPPQLRPMEPILFYRCVGTMTPVHAVGAVLRGIHVDRSEPALGSAVEPCVCDIRFVRTRAATVDLFPILPRAVSGTRVAVPKAEVNGLRRG